MKKIVIIGPAYPLRGGLATFNERFAKAFTDDGHDAQIYSFSLQYPSFLFPGKTQFSEAKAPESVKIQTRINSVNPLNWLTVGNELRKTAPDILIVRYWLPFMGPALGTILRQIKKNKKTVIIALTDNIIPHEKRPGDKLFTGYFLKPCEGFIAMSEKVLQDLRLFEPVKPAMLVIHPLYDNFGSAIDPGEARDFLQIGRKEKIVLFFGFIRKYKGLNLLFNAIKILKDRLKDTPAQMPKFLIAGEYYEDEAPYLQQIEDLGIADYLILHTRFIPDQEVKYFLCAADVVIQPYLNATQSGVTPLAYHFERPMIVSRAGNLPIMVPHEKAGLVADIDAKAFAEAVVRFFELGEDYFITQLRDEKKKYSWSKMIETVFLLEKKILETRKN